MQNVILKPYLTEKSYKGTPSSRYVFLVNPDATKGQIKELVEKLYKVNVLSVNTQKAKPLTSRSPRTGRYTTSKAYKKAIVQLKDKQTIPVFKTK